MPTVVSVLPLKTTDPLAAVDVAVLYLRKLTPPEISTPLPTLYLPPTDRVLLLHVGANKLTSVQSDGAWVKDKEPENFSENLRPTPIEYVVLSEKSDTSAEPNGTADSSTGASPHFA